MQVDVQPMEVSEAEDVWSCPTGIVPINSTPTDVSFLPALPAKDVMALPDAHLAPANMILDKGWQNFACHMAAQNFVLDLQGVSCLLCCARRPAMYAFPRICTHADLCGPCFEFSM